MNRLILPLALAAALTPCGCSIPKQQLDFPAVIKLTITAKILKACGVDFEKVRLGGHGLELWRW